MTPREQKYHQQGIIDGRNSGDMKSVAVILGQSLAKALNMPEKEAVEHTIRDYHRRLDALPPLAQYPELRGMRECVIAFNRGMAQGAGISEADAILRANFLPMMTAAYRFQKSTPPSAGPGCTLAYFPTSDRGPILANNNDGLVSHRHSRLPEPIIGNKAGLLIGTVSSGLFDDEASPQQFPAPVFMMVYEQCSTTAQAVELMTRLNLFWGPCNTLIADRHGDSAVIEKSTCRYGLRSSSDGFSATTEMSAEDPAYKAYLWETRERSLVQRSMTRESVDWAYWKAAEKRSARLLRLFDRAKANPTFAALESIIYDHTGQPEQVHMDGTKCHPDQTDLEWSLRTTIWVFNEHRAQYSFADPPVSGHLTERRWHIFPPDDFVF